MINYLTSLFRPPGIAPLNLTGEIVAVKPQMTIQALEGIRRQVRLNPLAGKGAFTMEQLENDALLAHYNTCVVVHNEEEKFKEAVPTGK